MCVIVCSGRFIWIGQGWHTDSSGQSTSTSSNTMVCDLMWAFAELLVCTYRYTYSAIINSQPPNIHFVQYMYCIQHVSNKLGHCSLFSGLCFSSWLTVKLVGILLVLDGSFVVSVWSNTLLCRWACLGYNCMKLASGSFDHNHTSTRCVVWKFIQTNVQTCMELFYSLSNT